MTENSASVKFPYTVLSVRNGSTAASQAEIPHKISRQSQIGQQETVVQTKTAPEGAAID